MELLLEAVESSVHSEPAHLLGVFLVLATRSLAKPEETGGQIVQVF